MFYRLVMVGKKKRDRSTLYTCTGAGKIYYDKKREHTNETLSVGILASTDSMNLRSYLK